MRKEFAAELVKKVLPSYEIKEILGEGSFGSVYRIADALKERAVKIILLNASPSIEKGSVTSADKKIERDFRHIVESYEKIACDEIVTVYDFFKISAKESNRLAAAYALVIMELYPSNLYDYVIGEFEKTRRLLDIHKMQSLMEKLAHMLNNLYIKRGFLFEDLKPENILVKEQNGDLKLVVGDIGGLKNLGSVSNTGSQVTLSYCAPEIIRKGQRPDLRSIIYSYGLIGYFMFEGRLPYEEHPIAARMDKLRDAGVIFDRKDIPERLLKTIEKCLFFEQNERFNDFDEIINAIQGGAIKAEDAFSGKTMNLDGFRKHEAKESLPAKESIEPQRRPILPGHALGSLNPSFAFRTMTGARKRVEQVSVREEINAVEKIDREIKDLVIKAGDIFKLQNEHCKVYNDIKVEGGAMLIIENAKLYFLEDAGILSSGTLRVKNSFFSSFEPSGKWKNVALCPTDTRINFIEKSKFIRGGGRTWGSMKNVFHIQNNFLSDNYLYGGAVFIAGAREKIITINDCRFLNCSAHEGAGLMCLRANPSIENSVFENCSAGMIGGGIGYLESNPVVRSCVLQNCSAHKEGGGMSCISSHPTIEGCTFTGCSTRYLYGGGIFCSGSNPTIKTCKFNRCTAKDGGGIYFDEKSSPKILYPAFSNCKPNNTNQDMNREKGNFYFR